jgi:hypothetical protein
MVHDSTERSFGAQAIRVGTYEVIAARDAGDAGLRAMVHIEP